MNKSEIIKQLESLFKNPKRQLNQKLGGKSRTNIWKWWNDPDRSSQKIEAAALKLIKEGQKAKVALDAAGVEIKF